MKSFDAIRSDLAAGRSSVEQLTESYLQTIERKRPLNAFLTVLNERALKQAKTVDRKLANGKSGSLAGMVVAVKDVLAMRNVRLTCGSTLLKEFTSVYDATVVQKLEEADAVIVGKTNLDEFAMGSSTENSAFGPVLHPQDASRVPGGSSGGSAVAVAAGMCTAALGSDTGGSVRQPAAFTGVVGVKPSYGRVSRYGLVAFASSFDTVGTFSANVIDATRVLQVIAGHDERDSTSSPGAVPAFGSILDRGARGLRVGIPKEYFGSGLNGEVRTALESRVEQLRAAGAAVSEVSLPHTEYCIAAYYVLATAEASSNLSRYDGARYGRRSDSASSLTELYMRSRTEGLGAEVKRRIMLGTYVLSSGYYDAYYAKAQKVRRLIQQDFLEVFKTVDVLLTPTAPTTAFKAGEKSNDPLQMYLNDIYTTSANLAGIPGISIPCGTDAKGLPIGLQLLAKQFDEPTMFRAAKYLEQESDTAAQ